MPNPQIIEFIEECRRRGFDDWQIKEPLLKSGWTEDIVNEAFSSANEKEKKQSKNKEAKGKENKEGKNSKTKPKIKNAITVYLDDDLVKIIDKRAKKNMMNFNEQVEDILRRSCISLKKQRSIIDKDLDDKFIGLFSRRNNGRARNKHD
jgi:hypothetical protein